MPDVTVASTTDTQDQVNQAAGAVQTEEVEERPVPTGDVQVDSGEQEAAPEPEPEPEKHEERPPKALSKKWDRLYKENKQLQERLAAIEAKQNTQSPSAVEHKVEEKSPSAAAAELDPEPTPDQFDTYEKYSVAAGRWAARAELRAIENKKVLQQQADVQKAEQERGEKLAEALMERGESKYDDFQGMAKGLFADTPKADALVAAIIEEDNGEDVIAFLRKNDEERKKLIAMPVAKAMTEIGKMALRINGGVKPAQETNNTNGKSPDRKPVISGAPPPIKPLGGHGVRSAVDLNDPDIDFQAFKRQREKEEKARRGY